MASKSKSIIGGMTVLGIAGIICKLVGVLFSIPLTYVIGAQGQGIYNAVFPTYNLLLTISSAGLPVAVSRMVSSALAKDDPHSAKHVFRVALLLLTNVGCRAAIIMLAGSGMLAAAMDNRGTLIASDTDRARLCRLTPRAERAVAAIIETVLLDPGREAEALARWQGAAGAVLVDAPCSGTGTWRRNPEARWRLGEAQLARYVAIQARLLDVAAGLVRPGGRLVFVTCSLLDAEGADQAADFLAQHPGWRPALPVLPAGSPRGQGWRLSPQRDGTDGFFIACFVSP